MEEGLFKQRSGCRGSNPGLTTLVLNGGREDSLGKPQRRELCRISPLENNSDSQSWRCEVTTGRKPEEEEIDSTLPPPVGTTGNQRALEPDAAHTSQATGSRAYWRRLESGAEGATGGYLGL